MSEHIKRSLRPSQVAERLGVSLPTVWRYVRADPTFPRPFKLSERVTVFDENEIAVFVESKRLSSAINYVKAKIPPRRISAGEQN